MVPLAGLTTCITSRLRAAFPLSLLGAGAICHEPCASRMARRRFRPERILLVGLYDQAFTLRVVAVRGLTLNKSKLFFADGTTAINAAAIAALEAKGLKITDKYYDGSVEIPVTSI